MALRRLMIDLPIPEDVYTAIPATKKKAFEDAVLAMKALAVVVKSPTGTEEMRAKATWHICHHDTGELCEGENEI